MEKLKIILFDEDKLAQTIIESYIKELTFDCSLEIYNGFNDSIIKEIKGLKVILANINVLNLNLLEKISDLSADKNNKFIIISNDNSTDMQVKVLRAGCCDFLVKPLVKADFIYSIQTVYNKHFGNVNHNNKTKILAAISYEEMAGKTFFLINLAKALSECGKTLLIDFNKQNNTSFFIKSSALTPIELQKKIKRYKNTNLFIMNNINLEKLNWNELKKEFDYILIDHNKITDNEYDEVFKNINRIFAIITSSAATDKSTGKYKQLLTLNKNINLIVNKYDKKYAKFIEKFQNDIGLDAILTIPNSVYALKQAHISSETIIEFNKNLDVSKSYIKLAQIISNGK